MLTFSAAILVDSLGVRAVTMRYDSASLPVTFLTATGQRNREKIPHRAAARTASCSHA